MPYLFTHFREKITPDGEQVYFAVSADGYNFEELNNGKPVLIPQLGEKGCRDIEIIRIRDGSFVILATDLCIARRWDENYNVDWKDCNHNGSKFLHMWRTKDLVNFSGEKLLDLGNHDFGCLWAPEVFYDEASDSYLLHWSSTVKENDFTHMSIYCSVTKDFESFSEPKLFFTKENEILDSHITKVGDKYHLFYKNSDPGINLHATSENLFGPYENDYDFQSYMETIHWPGAYEGPTTYILPDGKWCLMLDFFGCEKDKMGYVPFISPKAGDLNFTMAKELFSFPYGFKHGHCIEITDDEYKRLKEHYING